MVYFASLPFLLFIVTQAWERCREKLNRWVKQQQRVSVIGGGLFHASATGLMSFTQAYISWPDGRVISRKISNTLSGSI